MTGATPLVGNRWVRPFVLTDGRVHALLLVHTPVSVPAYDPVFAQNLAPEARRLYDRAATAPESVAELSAHCGVPLGVTRVLLADLADAGRVLVAPETGSAFDVLLLERVIDGLRAL